MALPATVQWNGDARSGSLLLLDQTLLPARIETLEIRELDALIAAIRRLSVRGAPAIGVAGAYGCVLALRAGGGDAALQRLADARPTAVNLRWAVERVRNAAGGNPDKALAEARAIHEQDRATCQAIGRHGAPLLAGAAGVLTHCNAGALATAGTGTALAPMFAAHQQGMRFRVFADETRPLLQGARLTALELAEGGLDVTVLADNMAADVLRRGWVQAAIVGADRIARNGDTANKIGTYGVAVLCRAHNVPLYVAAPRSTFDASLADGSGIPIEQRNEDELRQFNGAQIVPKMAKVYNPAFDVTPASLIAGFITEDGVFRAAELAGWLAP
ncbi:MAG: S-methyl-5-thioribose-1-phosphate isomerase [Planctomycetes bacterium]|nr:S-methyl-5-thioribose-1-phosphate isomerase [Planctomycetota bacterium]